MANVQYVSLDEVVAYFDELEDPRTDINRKHPLASVVVIALLAVLAGAGGPTAIARWAKLKTEFLMQVLDLPSGIPRQRRLSACAVFAQARRLSALLCGLVASTA